MKSSPESEIFVAHAVALLLARVRSARRILSDLDDAMYTQSAGVEEFKARRTEDLSAELQVLGRQLPVLLDLLGMNDTRQSFLNSWESVVADLGATEVIYDDINAFLASRPLAMVDNILEVLGAGSEGVFQDDPPDIKTLEYVLQSTSQILGARGIVPQKESDIQRALHDHLESTFPDYSREVKLPKGLKSFVPDGAIPSLEVLIEFKFVNLKKKLAPIFSGIVEDLSGYGGSRDWRRYYTVIYQTESFVNEVRFKRSLRLTGNAGNWKCIVVIGSGGGSKLMPQGKAQ